jgi:hypothetical protein
MDEQTRRDVDAACLRLMGHDPQWDADYGDWAVMIGGTRRHRCPSRDPSFIVPLAEAMRARGWHVVVQSSLVRPGQWEVVLTPNDQVYQSESDKAEIAFADTLPEALALAAARAVGTETKG